LVPALNDSCNAASCQNLPELARQILHLLPEGETFLSVQALPFEPRQPLDAIEIVWLCSRKGCANKESLVDMWLETVKTPKGASAPRDHGLVEVAEGVGSQDALWMIGVFFQLIVGDIEI
jgi:hypothetical protein